MECPDSARQNADMSGMPKRTQIWPDRIAGRLDKIRIKNNEIAGIGHGEERWDSMFHFSHRHGIGQT